MTTRSRLVRNMTNVVKVNKMTHYLMPALDNRELLFESHGAVAVNYTSFRIYLFIFTLGLDNKEEKRARRKMSRMTIIDHFYWRASPFC